MNVTTLSRQEIINTIRAATEPLPYVTAMWEGGSTAWERDDQWSDVDLQLLIEDESVDDTIDCVDQTLSELSNIELRFRVPQPTWHGHDQVFYRLADAGEFLLIDLAIMKRSNPNQFNERERHGERKLMFDKLGDAASIALDQIDHQKYLRATFEKIKVTFPLFQVLTRKELLRGNTVAAHAFYQSHTLQPLLMLLRILHCPDRFDFGPKYALFDLPPDIYETVESLTFVTGPDDIATKQQRAEALFEETSRRVEFSLQSAAESSDV